MARPRLVSQFNTGPAHPHPTHTALPIPGCSRAARSWWWRTRTWLRPSPPAFTWFFDITDERQPMPISTFQVDGVDPDGQPQSHVRLSPAGREVQRQCAALRLVRARPAAAGHQRSVPAARSGLLRARPAGRCERASSNDVTTDDRGLLYLLDRQRGLDIIESSVYGPDHDLSATSLWQQESQPAVPSGGAGGRLRLRIGPGGQGRERRHAGRHHRTAHARHHRSDAAGAAGGRLRPGRRGQGHRLPGGRARFRPHNGVFKEYFPDGCSRARPWRPARSSTPRSRSSASYKPQRS